MATASRTALVSSSVAVKKDWAVRGRGPGLQIYHYIPALNQARWKNRFDCSGRVVIALTFLAILEDPGGL